ncbi:MAG: MaoC/PaaZ C-terminal domain-containing protein [Beijerinckiaceae bacterium]|nr:MaoC/PaaZ C-terminal domain-containing protein [Beijerinckiaceae bacterium]
MIPAAELLAMPPRETVASHDARTTILYALGLGAASENATDPSELQYVYEEGLRALPTMPLVLAYPGFYLKEPQYRVDWAKVLHGEQRLTLHRAVPVAATIRSILTFDEIYDKGPDKGALLFATRKLYDMAGGDLVATLGSTSFLRGDGGCGGSEDSPARPHPVPDRTPDFVVDLPTRGDQALLYRLSGDLNPLHADPAVAATAGFERPILHGMATFGIVGRAVVRAICGNDPSRLRQLDARFSSPVFPGETIRTEIWKDGPGTGSLRARVVERDVVVLSNGRCAFMEGKI